jgi:hypothetical protein
VTVVVVVAALVVLKAAALVVFNCAFSTQTLFCCQIIFSYILLALTFYIEMYSGTAKD